jgi:hypothetical protein
MALWTTKPAITALNSRIREAYPAAVLFVSLYELVLRWLSRPVFRFLGIETEAQKSKMSSTVQRGG